jgi:membrane fusion protein, macrolide-specific efflux system
MTNALLAARRQVTARPWLSAAVVVALIIGGIVAYRQVSTTSTASSAATATTTLATVTRGSVEESVSATGTINPADEHDVSFSSSATVTSVRVKVGQRVTKGQILGTIATLSLESSLAQARADLANARATLAAARESSSTTSAQLSADKTSVATAASSVRAARTNLAGATLRSPITGTVASVNVSKGDTAGGTSTASNSAPSSSSSSTTSASTTSGSTTSSSSTSASSADFVVIGMKKWTAAVSVDDTEVGLIHKGDQAQLTTDNVSGRVFGIVRSVSVLSDSSSGSASYPVRIAITGSPAGLHDGASATISIIYKQVSNVLTVPTSAVHRDASTPYVYVSRNGAQTKVGVKIGISSGGTTQITGGLTAGEKVYVQTFTRSGGTSPTTGQSRSSYGYPGGGSGGSGGSGGFPGGGAFPGGGSGGFPGGQGGQGGTP